MTTTNLLKSSKRSLWLAAIKPPMYSVAIMPILAGTAVAFRETNRFNQSIFITFLLSAILILAWENLTNDVFDSETGIDKNKFHSVVNLTGNKALVLALGNLCLGLGVLGILIIAWWQQDPTVLGIILLCCVLGYMYQGPPFRLGYRGLGEFLCFFAFGPLAISAVYYSQTQAYSLMTLGVAVFIGISTSMILFCSHFHQVEDDIVAGKRSPIVYLGTAKGAMILKWATASLYGLTLLLILLGVYPLWTLLVFLSLPFAVGLVNHVQTWHDQPDKVSNSKFLAVNLHFFSGIFLSLGFILPH